MNVSMSAAFVLAAPVVLLGYSIFWSKSFDVMLLSAAGAFLLFWLFMRTGAAPGALFFCLMGAMGCLYSLLTLTVGPISAESVPAQLMSTASGMIIGIGEIFGGGAAPAFAGYIAKHFGIEHAITITVRLKPDATYG